MARRPKPRHALHGTYAVDGSRFIGLSDGKRLARVDAADFDWLNRSFWSLSGRYASRVQFPSKMHRLILGLTTETDCGDHINGDVLDNRRVNLRLATPTQNQGNRKPNVNHALKGVYRSQGGWRARLRIAGRCFYGTKRRDVVAAACDYNVLALRHFGEYAQLNRMD